MSDTEALANRIRSVLAMISPEQITPGTQADREGSRRPGPSCARLRSRRPSGRRFGLVALPRVQQEGRRLVGPR